MLGKKKRNEKQAEEPENSNSLFKVKLICKLLE